ncbi:MAG: hypothetical protein H0U53_09225, partial [Actinobacteria bacterium]|nr:hypothetical protein [Actinomycetota bacterium]
IGVASLLAMFVGGAAGGLMGARWHTKLERRAADDHDHLHDTTPVGAVGSSTPPTPPTGPTTGHQPPPAPGTGHQTGDIPVQPAQAGVASEEDGAYTQRSTGDTQTFRS